jgi:hypothetical protein
MSNYEEITVINQIKDELGVDFGWQIYSYGMVIPLESLNIIWSAIINLKEKAS